MSDKTQSPLWDDRQLAKHVKVSPRTPADWRLRGGGPPYIKVGRYVRYDPKSVQAWLDKHTFKNTSDQAA